VIPQVRGDPYSVSIHMGEAQLKGTKQPGRAWYRRRHEPELTEDALPLLNADPAPVPQVVEYVQHTKAAAWGELDGAPCGIQHPPKDLLPLAPATITFAQLLHGHCLLPSKGPLVRSRKHLVDRVHDAAADVPTSPTGALGHPDEVVDEDVDVGNGALMSEERGAIHGLRQRARDERTRLGSRGAGGGQRTH
jgi:hypothetical protein